MTAELFLVTGGAGFIGSHLVDALLAAGHQVRVLDDLSSGRRANLDGRADLVEADVAEPGVAAAVVAGVAGVFHLAAIASVARGNEDWRGTHRINLGGTVAVLDAARAAGRVPVVYASSAAVYGAAEPAVGASGLLDETLPTLPRTAYGADKLGCEMHARVGLVVHGVRSVGLRFFNVYGPRQDPSSPYSGVISIFADRLARGQGLSVHGDGAQTRDFVHVSDVVAHALAAMRRLRAAAEPSAEVLNVCTGRAVSVLDLALLLARLRGVSPAIAHAAERAGDIRRSVGSPHAAEATLGLRAAVRLEDGLAALPGIAAAV